MNQIGESSLDLTVVESSSPPVEEIFKKSHSSQTSNKSTSSLTTLESPNKMYSSTSSNSFQTMDSPNNRQSIDAKSPKTMMIANAWGWFVPADA